jgi:hypothetical protein
VRHILDKRDRGWSQRHTSDYVDGRLTPRERRRPEAHARLYPDCGRLRRSLTVLVSELRQLGRARPTGTAATAVIGRLRSEPLSSDSGGPAAPLP